MVKLRLKRMGSKHNAFYRIVVADARAPRDGKYIAEIGFYNPHTKETKINDELKNKWLKEGAVPSRTVKNIFAKALKTKEGVKASSLPKKSKKDLKAKPLPKDLVEDAKTKTEVSVSKPKSLDKQKIEKSASVKTNIVKKK